MPESNVIAPGEVIAELISALSRNTQSNYKLMAAIDDANAAMAALSTDVNKLIVAYNTPHATDSQVVALTTQMTSLDSAVNTALNPPTPLPPAPPAPSALRPGA